MHSPKDSDGSPVSLDPQTFSDVIELETIIELPEVFLSTAEKSAAELDALLSRLAAPIWDEAVAYLKEHRYLDLVALRDAIRERSSALHEEADRPDPARYNAAALYYVVEKDLKKHGPDARIGDAAPDNATRPHDQEDWIWQPSDSQPELFNVVLGLVLSHAYQQEHGEPLWILGGGFSPSTRWQAAAEIAKSNLVSASKRYKETTLRARAIGFRSTVLSAALEEYQLLGPIKKWSDGGRLGRFERLATDDTIVQICRALLEARAKDDDGFVQSRQSLYQSAADLLSGLSDQAIKDRLRAPEVHIHRGGSKRGSISKQEQLDELDHVLAMARGVVSAADGNGS